MVTKDIYMDDCLSGSETLEETVKIQQDLQYVVSQTGFRFKGFATSGQVPDASLSIDGVHVLTFGTLWDPKEDTIGLNIKEINFAKKVRGKKSVKIAAMSPKKGEKSAKNSDISPKRKGSQQKFADIPPKLKGSQ